MLFNLIFLPLFLLVAPLISFGPLADAELARLDPVFRGRVVAWLLLVRVVCGFQVLVTSGRRTAAQQLAQHQADPRNPAPNPARLDVHQRGVAVDVNFSLKGVPVLLKGSPAASWRPVYVLAENCGISNGSTFKGYPDNNHFYRS